VGGDGKVYLQVSVQVCRWCLGRKKLCLADSSWKLSRMNGGQVRLAFMSSGEASTGSLVLDPPASSSVMFRRTFPFSTPSGHHHASLCCFQQLGPDGRVPIYHPSPSPRAGSPLGCVRARRRPRPIPAEMTRSTPGFWLGPLEIQFPGPPENHRFLQRQICAWQPARLAPKRPSARPTGPGSLNLSPCSTDVALGETRPRGG
jgi:hypothetical protein